MKKRGDSSSLLLMQGGKHDEEGPGKTHPEKTRKTSPPSGKFDASKTNGIGVRNGAKEENY